MAEDVEILSEDRGEEADAREVEIVVAVSSSNDVSSTESSVDCIIDVVSTDSHSPAQAANESQTTTSSGSLHSNTISSNNADVQPRYSTTLVQVTYAEASNKTETSVASVDNSFINPASCASQCTSECDCEIIVDDLPSCSTDIIKCSGSSTGNGQASEKGSSSSLARECRVVSFPDRASPGLCFPANGSRRTLSVRSRSATPSPSLKCHTPSSPSTSGRQRSVSGSFYPSPSPRPSSNPGTPGERQRAGSMGELELRDRVAGRVTGVQIIDHLDISQLPRPRNPGGVLPQNGHPLPDPVTNNDALDLVINNQRHKRKCSNDLQQSTVFAPFISAPITNTSTVLTSKNSHSNYLISNLIRTTPTKVNKMSVIPVSFGTTNNGNNQIRGWSSSINECVERPKPSSEVDSEGVAKKIARLSDDSLLCSSTEDSLWRNRVSGHETQVRTPPERPKPPRRRFTPVPENVDGSAERFISPSRGRRRSSPLSTSSLHQSVARTTPHGILRTFRCSMCDYTTTEKSHLRRHRRLHHRSTPVNILKCGKCSYTTLFPRRMREHYHQIHNDSGTPGMVTELTDTAWLSPQRFMGSRGVEPMEGVSGSYQGPYFNHPDQLIYDRGDRAGFAYTGRQHGMTYPMEPFSMSSYPDVRSRHGDQMASNYLRSIVTSIINSESSLRHPPSSTITSSSFFLSPSSTNNVPHPNTCTTNNPCQPDTLDHLDIKVKVEPDIDDSSDISSTANSHTAITPDIQRHLVEPNVPYPEQRLPAPPVVTNGNADSSVSIKPLLGSHTDVPYSQSSQSVTVSDLRRLDKVTSLSNSARDSAVPSTSSGSQIITHCADNISSTTVNKSSDTKCETVSRGIQCVLPVIKTEIELDGDYYDLYGGHRFRFHGVDRAVQCDTTPGALSPPAGPVPPRSHILSQHISDRNHSMSESEPSDHHSSMNGDSRCGHCGISFDDDVIFSIHIGCHSHTDPFKCNVCGKQCGNKYVFYSHIMRGHQF